MIYALDLQTGYTECDICGSGHGYMIIMVDEAEELYRFQAGNKCHGTVDKSDLTRSQLLEAVSEWKFLVHTQYAQRELRMTLADIKRGRFAPGGSRNSGNPDDSMTLRDEQDSADSLCDCDSCREIFSETLDPVVDEELTDLFVDAVRPTRAPLGDLTSAFRVLSGTADTSARELWRVSTSLPDGGDGPEFYMYRS